MKNKLDFPGYCLILLVSLLCACSGTKNADQRKTTEWSVEDLGTDAEVIKSYVVLQKTSCYGKCPEYTFTLFDDLTCVVDAKRFFKVEGLKEGKISKEQMEAVKEKIKAIGFFNLKNSYDNELVQDIPPTYVSVSNDTITKNIKSRYGSPKGLIELQEMLEKIVNSVEWK